MNYRKDKYGRDLSILGYGCMRFPRKGSATDLEQTEAQILRAIELGINYFDTAYVYPGSEQTLGKILHKNGLRDKVYVATKLPHYLIKSRENAEKMFKEELARLQTDHVDYYLMHMLTDPDTWQRLVDLGIKDWIEEKKALGQIGQIGFSYHGNSETFCRLLDCYDWEFCQIQYNYMDEHSQAGRTGLHYAASKGIPVIIMEPLRGGRLAKVPDKASKLFASAPELYSPAGWSFRWLWDQPEVTVVLSGMNSLEMIEENAKTAEETAVGALTDKEKQLLKQVVEIINSNMKVGCTGCRYCMPCPKGVDIPGIFSAYNRRFSEGRFQSLAEYAINTSLRPNSTAASNCIGCGKCETHCPQEIPIRAMLKEAKHEFEGPVYKAATKFFRIIARF
jgi:predicted aldo/keto reductase-like oxidoreductase